MGDEMMILLDRLDKIEGKLGDEYGNTKTANFQGVFTFEVEGEGIIDSMSLASYGNSGHKRGLFMRIDDGSEFKFFGSAFISSTNPNDISLDTKIKFQKRLTLRAADYFHDATISYRLKKED